MKNIIFKVIVIISVVIGFTSCKKEPIPMPDNPQTQINSLPNFNPIGYTWELYCGRVFVENLDNGQLSYYNHFGPNKNLSNLDIFTESSIPFDIIAQGFTTWKFTSGNQLILDGGSSYNFTTNTHGIFNVYGLENGSQRNIEVINSTTNYMNVKVYESVGNDGTFNYSFYSVLSFVRSGFTTAPILSDVLPGYTYSGIVGGSSSTNASLVGTKWVINKFIQNFVSTYPNDTLSFISNTQYKINGSTPRNYSLSAIMGNNMKSLSLYSFTTLGGDWSGQVQASFINDWAFNNASFVNMMNTGTETRVWASRIQ